MVSMLTLTFMKKTLAIDAFGSVAALANAVGVRPQAIYQWPTVLTPRIADRVVAAAMREGIAMARLFPAPDWLPPGGCLPQPGSTGAPEPKASERRHEGTGRGSYEGQYRGREAGEDTPSGPITPSSPPSRPTGEEPPDE
jgi:hypothetical protein